MNNFYEKTYLSFRKGLIILLGMCVGYFIARFASDPDQVPAAMKMEDASPKDSRSSLGAGTSTASDKRSKWKKKVSEADQSIVEPLEQLLRDDDFTKSKLNLRLFNDDLSPNEEIAEILGVDEEEILGLSQTMKDLSSQLSANDKVTRIQSDQDNKIEFQVSQYSEAEKSRLKRLVRGAFENFFPPELADLLVSTSINQHPFFLGGLSDEKRMVRIENRGSPYRVSTILGETDTIFQSAAQLLLLEELPAPYSSSFGE
jgi:hypothetical protein